MREIKFRAWDDKNKRFWIEDALYGLGTYWNICPNGFVDATENNMCREPEDFVLQQFTGLKDKNGKEIYEGDVISVNDYPDKMGMYGEYGIVIFKEGKFLVQLIDTQRKFSIDKDSEVIGNKFENPELVE